MLTGVQQQRHGGPSSTVASHRFLLVLLRSAFTTTSLFGIFFACGDAKDAISHPADMKNIVHMLKKSFYQECGAIERSIHYQRAQTFGFTLSTKPLAFLLSKQGVFRSSSPNLRTIPQFSLRTKNDMSSLRSCVACNFFILISRCGCPCFPPVARGRVKFDGLPSWCQYNAQL